MPTSDERPILTTAIEVWNDLKAHGLDLKLEPVAGYDLHLMQDITGRLFPHSTHSLEENLREQAPDVEYFLAAFLRAAQPFSMMLTDVLQMLERADAHAGDEGASIAFDFELGKRLGISLEQFRRAQRLVQEAIVDVEAWRFKQTPMWDVLRAAQRLFGLDNVRDFGSVKTRPIREWLQIYGEPRFSVPPIFPRCGIKSFDNLLLRLHSMIRAFVEECMAVEPERPDFVERAPWRRGENPARRDDDLFVADSDYWPQAIVCTVTLASEGLAENPIHGQSQAEEFASLVTKALNELSAGRTPRTELLSAYRDILDLPLWKRRHELYAVWIAAAATRIFESGTLQYFTRGGELRFSFAPAKIAAIGTESPLEFWTEVRSPLLVASKVRKEGIQPDYRFLRNPYDLIEDTLLVIECKHYKKSSTKNFSAALNDYAASCPNAVVLLVNNGPIGSAVSQALDPILESRIHTVAELRPDNPSALSQFRGLISALTPLYESRHNGKDEALNLGGGTSYIRLEWAATFTDLDLHLVIRSPDTAHHVNFSDRGSLENVPLAKLGEDMRSGPGVETIEIRRWLDAQYDVYVHNYAGGLSPSHWDVSVTIQRASNPPITISGSSNGIGEAYWHVCSIEGGTGRLLSRGTTESAIPLP